MGKLLKRVSKTEMDMKEATFKIPFSRSFVCD